MARLGHQPDLMLTLPGGTSTVLNDNGPMAVLENILRLPYSFVFSLSASSSTHVIFFLIFFLILFPLASILCITATIIF